MFGRTETTKKSWGLTLWFYILKKKRVSLNLWDTPCPKKKNISLRPLVFSRWIPTSRSWPRWTSTSGWSSWKIQKLIAVIGLKAPRSWLISLMIFTTWRFVTAICQNLFDDICLMFVGIWSKLSNWLKITAVCTRTNHFSSGSHSLRMLNH